MLDIGKFLLVIFFALCRLGTLSALRHLHEIPPASGAIVSITSCYVAVRSTSSVSSLRFFPHYYGDLCFISRRCWTTNFDNTIDFLFPAILEDAMS
ncbi:uncharacterized protein BJ212DRAFT_1375696 [Suillus subaureus]|uniref:Secreted protein n=1 Tax=Suillus subaureus TaxID=48587 RepID=A0A9P7E5F9_9AGAM|nr:uncharacterized protein BJ212DRAFT_1375696 [Suillus subaureus]KAG1811217.1 hypothetical protein BJ212DRAFT_1375696 [Suillus subaureus]